MKKQLSGFIAILALLVAFSAANVSAQTGRTVQADIKFDFQIGEKTYPAGKYLIESISPASDNILQIRNAAKGKQPRIIIANLINSGKIEQPKLVFQKYGKKAFLSEIFLTNSKWGFALNSSSKQAKYSASAENETIEVRLSN